MKEDFKNFVNNHKELIKYVNSDKMTWQKFYDMYSLYGENSDVWNEYFNKKDSNKSNVSLKDILDSLKNLDADEVQKNINSLNKILSLISTLVSKDKEEVYEPMPLYKKFED